MSEWNDSSLVSNQLYIWWKSVHISPATHYFLISMLFSGWTSSQFTLSLGIHISITCLRASRADQQSMELHLIFYSVWHSFLYGSGSYSKVGRNLQSNCIFQRPSGNLGLYIKFSDECLFFYLPSALDIEKFLQSVKENSACTWMSQSGMFLFLKFLFFSWATLYFAYE